MIRADYFMNGAKIAHSPKLIPDPAVSVILPTFCRGDNGLLKTAIDSVLAQTFSSFELIVMDDGSTDSTASVVSEYVKQDDRVIHVRHESNCGLPALRVNEGLLMARGEFCAYQFDDDQWTNTALATLVGGLRKNPRFEITYGRCACTVEGDQIMLGGPFNYSQLVAGNFIANNSLVHRRSVFERFGGYDMHVVMRRLCDWDLWLRWGRHEPFLFVDELVSVVEGGRADSVGKLAAVDSFVTRVHMTFDRTASLRPDALKSYLIDTLHHLKHLGESKVAAIWRQQLAPYQSQLRQIWPALRPPATKRLHVLSVKAHFDTTVDIMIGNYVDILAADFAFTFVPQSQADEAAIRCVDILLLYRAIDQHAQGLVDIARKHGKAVVFLMDDDLTTIYQLSPEFSYLAPGAPCYQSLECLIRDADLVITYSRAAQESVEFRNPRNVVLETNIRRERLANAKSRLETPPSGEYPVRIGFAGGGARQEEFAFLWPAIVEASRQLGARAEFHFWGFTPEGLERLHSPYYCESFTYSYEQYMGRLTSAGFDVMIVPLFGEKRAKRAKCPIKFLEITAAGAVGVYSNVEPYWPVVDGVSGIKCENTVDAWSAAILRAASLPPAERNEMLRHAIQAVERDYTTEQQAAQVAATLEAAALHGLLKRSSSGKPRIAYFCHSAHLAGGENNLLRHAELAQAFQFEPVFVMPRQLRDTFEEVQRRAVELGMTLAYLPLTIETETDASRQLDQSAVVEIQSWLRHNRIGLAHSVTLMREVGEAADRLGIPHVASLYATNSQGSAGFRHCDVIHSDSFFSANRWSDVLNAPVRRIMSYVPEQYFDLGDAAEKTGGRMTGGELVIGMFGSLQPRKGQLQAVEAVGLLKKQWNRTVRLSLFGYDHFYPDYLAACREAVVRHGISDLVSFASFTPDQCAALREVDVVLCASDWESLPLTILEAMAARRLVIAPNVGGIPEIVSRRTGVLMPDNTAPSLCRAFAELLDLTHNEWREKTSLAREVVQGECSRYLIGAELFRLYQQAATARAVQSDRRANSVPELPMTIADGTAPFRMGVCEALEGLRSSLREINADLQSADWKP